MRKKNTKTEMEDKETAAKNKQKKKKKCFNNFK